jgi:glycine reductase complex component B subunit gamma
MRPIRVVHYLNQFFAGIGGEARASVGPELRPGPVGPGRVLEQYLGERGAVAATLICGDDAFHQDPDLRLAELITMTSSCSADVLIAGPAFNAGRYGVACGRLCEAVTDRLGLPAVTAMFRDNPGVPVSVRGAYILPTSETSVGMREALEQLVEFALKLAARSPVGPADEERYLPRGRRINVIVERPAAERVVDVLIRKLRGQPCASEIPTPSLADMQPAPPVADLRTARIALATEGGVVPRGNPDRVESRRATAWRKYPVPSDRLSADRFECVHSGFNTQWVQDDPNRVLPADVTRDLERDGRFGELHDHYYVTVGVGTGLREGERFGRQIGEDLRREGVEGVIMTAT